MSKWVYHISSRETILPVNRLPVFLMNKKPFQKQFYPYPILTGGLVHLYHLDESTSSVRSFGGCVLVIIESPVAEWVKCRPTDLAVPD